MIVKGRMAMGTIKMGKVENKRDAFHRRMATISDEKSRR